MSTTHFRKCCHFIGLASIKRDAFCVLPHTHKAVAHVSFHGFLVEVQPNKRLQEPKHAGHVNGQLLLIVSTAAHDEHGEDARQHFQDMLTPAWLPPHLHARWQQQVFGIP
jgi:hypothetical protein